MKRVTTINTEFDELCELVKYCTLCPRMDSSARVLSRAAGPLDASLMFIGEAPGRLGADESEIPFHGDKAGHNFEELLSFAGIERSEIFVTNAVLCNPKDDAGNNATPNKVEVRNCNSYLKREIDLVQPKIVVTLGSTALEAARKLSDHSATLQKDVRSIIRWYGRLLVPLYHPGQRAMMHRSMANQRSDYQFVAEQLRRLVKPQRGSAGRPKLAVMDIISVMLRDLHRISYFGLHKIFFLLEYEAAKTLGHTLTRAHFIRQKDGPYCTDLHIQKLKKGIADLIVLQKEGKLFLTMQSDLLTDKAQQNVGLSNDSVDLIKFVAQKYGALEDTELKTRVYLTAPMRQMLKMEKEELVNLTNAPIDLLAISAEHVSGSLAH